MTYETLLANAPDHLSPEFLEYLKEHNEVVFDDDSFLAVKNVKYGWTTAFAKTEDPRLDGLIVLYGDYEWRVKPKSKRTVKRFHIHIIDNI